MLNKTKESGTAKATMKEITPAGVMKAKLAKSHSGRVILHLGCLLRDSKWAWHLAGICRELTKG